MYVADIHQDPPSGCLWSSSALPLPSSQPPLHIQMATSSSGEQSSGRRVTSLLTSPFSGNANSRHSPSSASPQSGSAHGRSVSATSFPGPPQNLPPLQTSYPAPGRPALPPRKSLDTQPGPPLPPKPLPPTSTGFEPPQALLWRPPNVERPPIPQISMTPNTPSTPVAAGEPKPKRKSWMPSLSSSSSSSASSKLQTNGQPGSSPRAWIAGESARKEYDLDPLLRGHSINELWDDSGGPAFRVHSQIFASSTKLMEVARQIHMSRKSGQTSHIYSLDKDHNPQVVSRKAVPSKPGTSGTLEHGKSSSEDLSSKKSIKIYLSVSTNPAFVNGRAQLSGPEIETLIDIRNTFAFLVGQALVATERRISTFSIFMSISTILQSYDFTNGDGSTFGEVASYSFDKYVDELGLADIRAKKEETIEALILAEHMRSVSLYNEAFVHTVGQYEEIQRMSRLAGPEAKFNLVSSTTRNRLERASLDLQVREQSIELRLAAFDFPSMFTGVMNSRQVDERKFINFDGWKASFNSTRKYVLSYLKTKYGSWPPKASSKKNDLEIDGLNRMVLKSLYYDMADIYDLYVDRTSLTTRTMDAPQTAAAEDDSPGASTEYPSARILRRVFDEYDRSSPPVQPPVPFDQPIFPNLAHITGGKSALNPAETKKLQTKKLSAPDLGRVLEASVNADTLAASGKSPFVAAIRAFESKQAKGCTLNELAEIRAGMWIFIYAVIQALPMLVMDAPGVKKHQGVEYFLCQPPRLGVPWAKSGTVEKNRRSHNISGGGGMVSLPTDLIEHGVEGIYQRSHCWLVGAKWMAQLPSSSNLSDTAKKPAGTQRKWNPPPEITLDSERAERVEIHRHESTRLAPPRPIRLSDESVRSGAGSGASGFNTPRSGSPHTRPQSRDRRGSGGRENAFASGAYGAHGSYSGERLRQTSSNSSANSPDGTDLSPFGYEYPPPTSAGPWTPGQPQAGQSQIPETWSTPNLSIPTPTPRSQPLSSQIHGSPYSSTEFYSANGTMYSASNTSLRPPSQGQIQGQIQTQQLITPPPLPLKSQDQISVPNAATHKPTTSKTFNDILGSMEGTKGKKGKKGK